MQKQLPLIIGAIIVIILAIGGFLVYSQSKKSSTSPQSPVTQETQVQGDEISSKGSLKDLIGLGKNVTCTVSYPSDDMTVNGTVYVAGDKRFRADFITKQDNRDIDSHMIVEGGWNYIWSSASPQGTKMKIEENVGSPTPGPQDQNVDVNTEVDYKCSSWSVDNSKFVPPSNIQFVEFSMPALQSPSTTGETNTMDESQQQAICAQITDPEAKAACIEATSGN